MTKKKQTIVGRIVQQACPPIILTGISKLLRLCKRPMSKIRNASKTVEGQQDLDIYWDTEMAEILDTWGEDSVWKEIQLLMVNCQGKVLDIACGTGKTMTIVSKLPVDVHGCDISDLLIGKAIERGIDKSYLTICDATKMPYEDDYFDFAYSIGSLEHFTEEGITLLLEDSKRVVRKVVFHMIPVSRSGEDEGWLKTYQSFHNNSVAWWLEKYQSVYKTVYVLDSTWSDNISVGKWFICVKDET